MINELQEILAEFGIEKINTFNMSLDEQNRIIKYLKHLDPKEKKAFLIAKNHLGTSFNIVKSTGYNDWKKNSNNIINT